jgi:diguanylate cyclase
MEVEHERLARRDALTGLANRLQLDETLDKALSTAAPQVAVVCLDLDRFKAVNDAFGHPVGDTLLVEAARRLQACAKPGDTIVRVGGDEFTIVRPRYETHGEVERLAQSLTTAFRKPFLLAGQMMLVHTSVGVAMALQDGSSRRELIEKADAALYRAKAEGRNRHAFASPLPDVQSTHAAGKSATGRT